MKTKQMVYLGLTFLLLISSFINLPTQVLAAETSESSSSSQTSSVPISESSSSQAATSSSSESSSTSSSSAVQSRSAVAPKDTTADPAAPTSADGVLSSSWEGLWIIVPILTGITVQPQLEQYIVADPTTKLATPDLSIKLSSWTSPKVIGIGGSTFTVTPTRWTWNDTTSKWDKTTDTAVKVTGVTDTNPKISLPASLKAGTYYFQYDVNVFTLPLGLGSIQKTSKLVKVKVVDAPIDATKMTLDVPPVIFEQASYDGTATTTPADATGTITWKSDPLYGNITWNQQTGRNANFIIKQPTDVNTSTTNPGIQKRITATITRAAAGSISLLGYTDVYTGGLVAKEMASDAGGTWALDSQGLTDLGAATTPADGSAVPWTYQWKYSTDGGTTFTNMTSSNSDGVSNYKGSIAHITDLNNAANQLTFTKNSGFVKNAAAATTNNKNYVMQVVLTASVPTGGSGSPQTITINSNKASFKVTGALGYLSLDQVPSFNFDNITAADIYNGTQDVKSAKTSQLEVTDTRTSASNYWGLSAKMTKMTSDSGNQLENNVTILDKNVGKNGLTVTDNDTDVLSITSPTGGSLSSDVNGKLYLDANHKTQLTDNEHFTSTITWTLNSSAPTARAAK